MMLLLAADISHTPTTMTFDSQSLNFRLS